MLKHEYCSPANNPNAPKRSAGGSPTPSRGSTLRATDHPAPAHAPTIMSSSPAQTGPRPGWPNTGAPCDQLGLYVYTRGTRVFNVQLIPHHVGQASLQAQMRLPRGVVRLTHASLSGKRVCPSAHACPGSAAPTARREAATVPTIHPPAQSAAMPCRPPERQPSAPAAPSQLPR